MVDKLKLITNGEYRYNSQIKELVSKLMKSESRIVLLSGPSGSGKTTSAKMIVNEVINQGKKAVYLSMDDWFKTKADYDVPRTEDGKLDFESPICVNIELLNKNLGDLLEGKEVELPKYDFVTQKMYFDGDILKIDANTIIVIEGLHALNPFIEIDRNHVFRVFVKPSDVEINNILFDDEDTRLYRRISRDKLHRGRSLDETLEMLSSVTRGERLYLYPHVVDLDYQINSFIDYELYLHKSVLGAFEKLKNLDSLDITINDIPDNSLLWEFYK